MWILIGSSEATEQFESFPNVDEGECVVKLCA
jgi:hypothetical protein